MRAVGVVKALGPIDLKSVVRDSLMRWMVLMPVLLALAFRWGVPPVAAWLADRFGIELAPYHPLLASMLVMTTPMMYGTVIGFLLLDQKDDRTLSALLVTPLTTGGYLAYRIGIPVVLSVVMTVFAVELSGLARPGIGRQLVAAVGAAPLAPVYALFLAAFARNKVQGFALVKAAGALNWPPVLAWFVHSDWQWAFGLCPTYWSAKLYWEMDAGAAGGWLVLPAAIVVQGSLVAALLRRFDRAMHR